MNPGFSVMLNDLSNKPALTIEALKATIDREIKSIRLTPENEIIFELENGTLTITDNGQSCCESRYITTDSDLPSYIGKKIVDFRLEPYVTGDGDYDLHDTQVFKINTTEGVIDFVTHVEHNGYYGGFALNAVFVEN